MSPSTWYKDFMSGYGFDFDNAKPYRPKPGPIATLGQLAKDDPRWVWLCCGSLHNRCHHKAAMPLVPVIIRWGADAPVTVLWRRARCSRCGHLGATTSHPSIDGLASDRTSLYGPFPVEQRAVCCRPDGG